MKRRAELPAPKSKSAAKPDKRNTLGRARDEAAFPVAPARAELPPDYADTLADIKQRVSSLRTRVVIAANTAMVELYWDIGPKTLGYLY